MIASGIRELFVMICSNRYIYRIPIKYDMIGKVISINSCDNWLEIQIEVKEREEKELK